MKKVGMYGGDFNPLHIGHISNIISASAMCEKLYIIICCNEKRDTIKKELKYRWVLNSTKHLNNVKIALLEDNAVTKDTYDDSYWKKGAKDIKSIIGEKIDIVFCGSDYKGTNRFELLYPESEIFYFERNNIKISSSDIRNNPFKYWDYIPNIVKPIYNKKILIIGGESTGKSTLVENLALIYNTNFVSEVGRDTCEYAGGEDYMIMDDLIENLLRQKINVDEAIKNSNKLLFVDTDALTTLFYSNFLLTKEIEINNCTNLANAICNINKWDLVLFLEPTVNFIQDGTRNEKIAENRIKYSEQIKLLFDNNNIKYEIINDNNYIDRLNKAKNIINEKFFS